MTEYVLVSGGSGGIGAALCRHLADEGFRPVIGYASGGERAEALAAETGGKAVALDMFSRSSIDGAIEFLENAECNLAGVVLAASPPPVIEPIFRLPDDELDKQWDVNVRGPHALLGGVIRRLMRPRKTGWIVGILTDAMGENGTAAKSMGGYIIAKYGMKGLLKVVDAEYGWLKVETVSFGYTETPMLKVFDDRFLDQMRDASPNGRFATSDEVAENVVQLIRGL